MSTSSPTDLAVAFRSMPRRLRQASNDAAPSAISAAATSVSSIIAQAARLMSCEASSDAVAAAIGDRDLEDWTDQDLISLQALAQTAGRAIRVLEESVLRD
jgi:hypothetical protein